jgi:hypothetical protein
MATYILQPVIAGPSTEPLDNSDVAGNVIRHVSTMAPVVTGWNVNDLWADSTTEATTGQVLRRFTGTGFLPARGTAGGSAPVYFDQFSLSNGTVVNATNWITGFTPSTGSGYGVTCQDGRARFTTSNAGGFAFSSRISRRFQTNAADYNMSFSFKYDSTTPSVILWARADNTMGFTTGYSLELGKGDWTITKWVAGVQSPLTTAVGDRSYGFAEGIEYSLRYRIVGSSVGVKIWPSAQVEPSAWDYQATDATISASGAWGIAAGAGSAAINHNFYVDNFTLEAS